MRRTLRLATLMACCVIPTGQVAAQTAPDLSQTVPGREQVDPRDSALDRAPSQVRTTGGMENLPCALEGSSVLVTLNEVRFEGASADQPLPPEIAELLAPLSVPPAGERPISAVCDIRDAVNQTLSQEGYIALAQIPAQQIQNGVLVLRVVTARFVEMRVLGDVGGFEETIAARAERIRGLDPLNRNDIERILLETGDIPGIDVTMTISPARTGNPGDVIGVVAVETQRFQALANIQNYGSPELGRWVASVRVEGYGLTGMSDRTVLTYSNSIDFEEIRVLQASHDFAIGAGDLRGEIRGSIAWSRPDVEDLELSSQSIILGAEVQKELERSLTTQVRAAIGAEFLEQTTKILTEDGSFPFVKDSLRVAYARIDGDFRRRLASGGGHFISGYAELRKGFSILGGSKRGLPTDGFSPSRFDGDPEAIVAKAEVVGDIQLLGPLRFGFGAFAQWADEPLLNLEEWTLGNFTYGRGYDPGSNAGDRVVALRAEPTIEIPIGNDFRIEVLGFVDWVRLDNLDPGSIETGRELMSYGGGLRTYLSGRVALEAYYAMPRDFALTTDEARPENRFLLTLSTRFYPWGNN